MYQEYLIMSRELLVAVWEINTCNLPTSHPRCPPHDASFADMAILNFRLGTITI
jgi:hypothetical protein